MIDVFTPDPVRGRLGAVALIALVALAAPLSGCDQTLGLTAAASQTAPETMPGGEAQLRAYTDSWGKRYDQDPGEKTASINYARGLRALTRYSEAAAVMQAAAVKAPEDYEVLGAYGKALADSGQLAQAKDVLTRAYPDDRPDWTIMSVQGAVDDMLGDHDGARVFYTSALKIAPGEANVLNNLGLSYALTKQLPQAEAALREASVSPHADARVHNNLALILSLEGKHGQAAKISSEDILLEAAQAKPAANQPTPDKSAGS